jgi:hypothetical protein
MRQPSPPRILREKERHLDIKWNRLVPPKGGWAWDKSHGFVPSFSAAKNTFSNLAPAPSSDPALWVFCRARDRSPLRQRKLSSRALGWRWVVCEVDAIGVVGIRLSAAAFPRKSG